MVRRAFAGSQRQAPTATAQRDTPSTWWVAPRPHQSPPVLPQTSYGARPRARAPDVPVYPAAVCMPHVNERAAAGLAPVAAPGTAANHAQAKVERNTRAAVGQVAPEGAGVEEKGARGGGEAGKGEETPTPQRVGARGGWEWGRWHVAKQKKTVNSRPAGTPLVYAAMELAGGGL